MTFDGDKSPLIFKNIKEAKNISKNNEDGLRVLLLDLGGNTLTKTVSEIAGNTETPNLQAVLDTGNISIETPIIISDNLSEFLPTNTTIKSSSIIIGEGGNMFGKGASVELHVLSGLNELSATVRDGRLRLKTANSAGSNISNATISPNLNSTGIANFILKRHNNVGTINYVIATTSDFKTINNESLIGSGNISIGEVITKTKTEIDTLIGTAELSVGALYEITECDTLLYGGTTLYLKALTTSQLEQEGTGLFYTPKYDQTIIGYNIWTKYMNVTFSTIVGTFVTNETVTANNGATATLLVNGFLTWVSGDWNTAISITGGTSGATANITTTDSPSYSIGNIVHWGGKTWINLNGSVGTSIDKYTLSPTEWDIVEVNSINYNIHLDTIVYDYEKDIIISRKDKYNNEVSGTNQWFIEVVSSDGYNLGNPIKDFQWGNGQDNFNTDDYEYVGVQSNTINDSYFDCLNSLSSRMWNNRVLNRSTISTNTYSKTSEFLNNIATNDVKFSNNIIGGVSFISNNTISNSSSISTNFLSINSSINGNILTFNSDINENILTPTLGINYISIEYNVLTSGSIENNILLGNNSGIKNNTLNYSAFANITLNSSVITNNPFNNSNIQNISITSKTIQYVTGEYGAISGEDLSLATVIFLGGSKILYRRPDNTRKIRYYNNSDVLVIADITD